MSEKHYISKNDQLMSEWDWKKNNVLGFDPQILTQGCHVKVWWICEKGHSYEAQIVYRVKGSGCPYCAGKKALKGYNDLQTVNPALAKEWNYEKNTEDGHYQIDPVYAPLIVEIYQMYLDGMSMKRIVDELKARGIRNRKGGEISENVVRKILENRRYLGEYIFRDIVIPNGIPQIVPQELFNQVQERIERIKKAPARHKAEEEYLLSTKLFCGKCERMMAGESGTSRENIVYRYYKCSGVKRKLGCDKKTVRKAWIEDLVVDEIKKVVNDDELIAYIADCVMELQGKSNSLLPCLRHQLSEVEKGMENLINAMQMGIVNDMTKKRMSDLEARRSELQVQIAKEELAKPIVTREQIICWLEHFRTFDTNKFEHRRRFIDTFVNRIFLYDDKMVITFNYNKGTKTITFAELEASGILSSLNRCSAGEPKTKSRSQTCSLFFPFLC